MAIEANGRFTPNATKGALELFSVTDMTRALTKLNCGLTRDQVALIASAYEQLFTPASVRRSKNGLVRERLLKKVQEVFQSSRQALPVAAACEQLNEHVLEVKDGDWSRLYVQLAVALGMDPDATECAQAVVQLRREQGKKGEDAMFAAEQFGEMWSKSDLIALEATREFECILRDVTKTCLIVTRKGLLEDFKKVEELQRREISKVRERPWQVRTSSRAQAPSVA